MNKSKKIIISAVAVSCLTVGAIAATTISNITAQLRPDIKIAVDGQVQQLTDAAGNAMQPISYNGSTYIPVVAAGNIFGKNVAWNPVTKTVVMSGSNNTSSLPTVDTGANTTTTDTKISNFKTRANEIATLVNGLTFNGTASQNSTKYRQVEASIDALELELDTYSNELRLALINGTLDSTSYNVKRFSIEEIDDYLDSVDDVLERKLSNSYAGSTGNVTVLPSLPNDNVTTAPVTPPTTTVTPPATTPVTPSVTPPATTPVTPSTGNTITSTINGFETRVAALEKAGNAIVPAASYSARLQQYRDFKYKVKALEQEMDRYEDTAEYKYKTGAMTWQDYSTIDAAIDRLDDRLDYAEDMLEYKLGIDD